MESSEDPVAVTAELVSLRQGLQELRRAARPALDGAGPLPMDPTVMQELKQIVEELQGLQKYSEQGITRVGRRVEIRTMTGEVLFVSVNPETDSVEQLKAKIAEQRGIKPFRLKLFPDGADEVQAQAFKAYEAAKNSLNEAQKAYDEAFKAWRKVQDTQMANSAALSDYDLTKAITMIVSKQSVENEIMRLLFDNPEDLSFENVSGKSGTWLFPEQRQAIDSFQRRGIEFQGHCVLRLAEPIVLGDAWTISVWTLAPIDTSKPFRNLVDDTGDNRIVVAILGRKIGDYNLHSFVDYDVGLLPDGWHHIVAVGSNGSVSYYVDGNYVGRHGGQTKGRISTVGNRGDGQCSESWGVMSDLRIFGSAASAAQVAAMFDDC